jgi:hypothetical protein
MKKKLSFGWIALSLMSAISTPLALADGIGGTPIEITSSKFPGQVFTLTTLTDMQGDLKAFAYDDANGPQQMPLAPLYNGLALVHMYGTDIIKLSIDRGFTAQHGGRVYLTYIRNAILRRYGTLMMDYVREGAVWSAYEVTYTRRGGYRRAAQPFTHMDFIPARTGISYIKVW